jgi:hypothetical protein
VEFAFDFLTTVAGGSKKNVDDRWIHHDVNLSFVVFRLQFGHILKRPENPKIQRPYPSYDKMISAFANLH